MDKVALFLGYIVLGYMIISAMASVFQFLYFKWGVRWVALAPSTGRILFASLHLGFWYVWEFILFMILLLILQVILLLKQKPFDFEHEQMDMRSYWEEKYEEMMQKMFSG